MGKEQAELREAFGTELVLPFALDAADDVAHRLGCASAAAGERDALEALVARIVAPLQVAEPLELAEQVVQGLFAHAALCGELRWAELVGAGPLQDTEVRGADVGETTFVQP